MTRKLLHLGPDAPLPPLCVLAIPVLIGRKVVGLIRCAIAEGPYYLSIRDFALLRLIAAQIAQCWSTWLSRREKDAVNASWEKLAQTLVSLNELVQKQVAHGRAERDPHLCRGGEPGPRDHTRGRIDLGPLRQPQDPRALFRRDRGPALAAAPLAADGAIRVSIDPEPGDSRPRTVALHAIQTRLVELIPDVSVHPTYKELFSGVRRMILAPIVGEARDFGVLSLRGFDDYPFPRNAPALADLLARQIGLYRRLLDTIRRLRRRRSRSRHGPTSPTSSGGRSRRRSSAPTSPSSGPARSSRRSWPCRGLCRKAQHVVASLRLLADLASNRPPEPSRQNLGPDQLIKMLIEASQDTELMIHPKRNIHFHVEREKPSPHRRPAGDSRSTTPCSNRPSTPSSTTPRSIVTSNTTVKISGGYQDGFFVLAVTNVGLSIRGEEVRHCLLRQVARPRARSHRGRLRDRALDRRSHHEGPRRPDRDRPDRGRFLDGRPAGIPHLALIGGAPMRILLVEDDWIQEESMSGAIRDAFPEVVIESLCTELEFRNALDRIAADPPDLVIFDIMIRWTDPSPDLDESALPAEFSRQDAGLRCHKLLIERVPHARTLLYSILDREDIGRNFRQRLLPAEGGRTGPPHQQDRQDAQPHATSAAVSDGAGPSRPPRSRITFGCRPRPPR